MSISSLPDFPFDYFFPISTQQPAIISQPPLSPSSLPDLPFDHFFPISAQQPAPFLLGGEASPSLVPVTATTIVRDLPLARAIINQTSLTSFTPADEALPLSLTELPLSEAFIFNSSPPMPLLDALSEEESYQLSLTQGVVSPSIYDDLLSFFDTLPAQPKEEGGGSAPLSAAPLSTTPSKDPSINPRKAKAKRQKLLKDKIQEKYKSEFKIDGELFNKQILALSNAVGSPFPKELSKRDSTGKKLSVEVITHQVHRRNLNRTVTKVMKALKQQTERAELAEKAAAEAEAKLKSLQESFAAAATQLEERAKRHVEIYKLKAHNAEARIENFQGSFAAAAKQLEERAKRHVEIYKLKAHNAEARANNLVTAAIVIR